MLHMMNLNLEEGSKSTARNDVAQIVTQIADLKLIFANQQQILYIFFNLLMKGPERKSFFEF